MSIFSSVRIPKVPTSTFKNTFERKQSFKAGFLVPFYFNEMLPGDKFKINLDCFLRTMPMVNPIMHQVDVNFSWFFVPTRLVWDEFQDFITGGPDGTLAPVKPYFDTTDFAVFGANQNLHNYEALTKPSSLPDYLGIPTVASRNLNGSQSPIGFKFDALPFRAYQLIYNTYFRDQNLQEEVEFATNSGHISDRNQVERLLTLRRVCWKKDYFTSALPWAQRGPEVVMPLNGDAPVQFSPNSADTVHDITDSHFSATLTGTKAGAGGVEEPIVLGGLPYNSDGDSLTVDNSKNLKVDLSNVSAPSINELRRLERLQQFFERNAVGGGRYIEQILSHFGIMGDDARLQLPQYLGGGSYPLVISEVAQTAPTKVDQLTTPLGTLGGKALSSGNLNVNTGRIKEHGYLFCLGFVRPRPAYQQGLPKMFQRWDKLDYYFPEFARLGEQAVKRSELFLSNDPKWNDETFGYQSRYADYKYVPDTTHGQLRTTLDRWTMTRKFNGSGEQFESALRPVLNGDFVACHPTKRCYAITDEFEDELIAEVQFSQRANRRMPYHVTPSL